MTRIPYRSADVLPQGIPPLNLFRMMAYSPSTLPHILSLGTAIFRDTSLPAHLRELLCLMNANRLCCEYQWKQHVPTARQNNVSEQQITALLAGDLSSDIWSSEEKALLAFIDQVIERPEIEDEVFENARAFFGDQSLVELVTMQVGISKLLLIRHEAMLTNLILQGFYYSLARIATTFHVDVEQPNKEEPQKVQKVQIVRN